MLTNADPAGLAKSFLDFVLSPEGQEVVVEHGYLKAVK
jgi:ABC-type Fe3+ transport system substrate-binding protein